jgi:hypothetical protein
VQSLNTKHREIAFLAKTRIGRSGTVTHAGVLSYVTLFAQKKGGEEKGGKKNALRFVSLPVWILFWNYIPIVLTTQSY